MTSLSTLLLAAAAANGTADVTVVVDLTEGALQVQESWMIQLDEAAASGQLSIPLPDGAQSVTQPQEQQGYAFDATVGRVFNQSLVAAGRNHVFFNYKLPYGSPNQTLRWSRPDLNVRGLRIAVPEIDGLTVNAPDIVARTVRELSGVPFELVDVRAPFQSGALSIALRGLPVRALWPRWFAVALCVALAGLTAYLLVTQRGARNPDRTELQARKERLLQALQILEGDRPEMEEAAYGRRRNELLTDLAEVLRREAR